MLRRAAAAQPMKQMKHHRHPGLAAGHRVSIRRFVGHLRPCFVNETAGAQIDDRPQAGHRRAGGKPAEAEFRNRRRDHALAIFAFKVLVNMAVRAQA